MCKYNELINSLTNLYTLNLSTIAYYIFFYEQLIYISKRIYLFYLKDVNTYIDFLNHRKISINHFSLLGTIHLNVFFRSAWPFMSGEFLCPFQRNLFLVEPVTDHTPADGLRIELPILKQCPERRNHSMNTICCYRLPQFSNN